MKRGWMRGGGQISDPVVRARVFEIEIVIVCSFERGG